MAAEHGTQIGTQAPDKPTPSGRAHKPLVLSIPLALTVTLSITIVVSAALSVFNTISISNITGDDRAGWQVVASSVTTEHNVVIDKDLEVKKDLKVTGLGSFVELAGVDCGSEEPAPAGSGRLCFDRAESAFMVSESGGQFSSLGFAVEGEPGLACWDLDGNTKADEGEDVNGDRTVDVSDCRGLAGSPGLPGTACWDWNASGEGEPAEDTNGDGVVDSFDCKGLDGPAGTACWDLNANGDKDAGEDVNFDELVDIIDCRGSDGLVGPAGTACWDLNANGKPDMNEDINSDGALNAFDCRPTLFAAGVGYLGLGELSDELEEIVCCGEYPPTWARIELPEALYGAWKEHVSVGAPRLNVHVTALNKPMDLYVYIASAEPAVYVVYPQGDQGTFHYLIQVVP